MKYFDEDRKKRIDEYLDKYPTKRKLWEEYLREDVEQKFFSEINSLEPNERLKYLRQAVINFEQANIVYSEVEEKFFPAIGTYNPHEISELLNLKISPIKPELVEFCRLEISKLEAHETMYLKDVEKHKDLTLDRAIVFLDFLFNFNKADVNKTARAEAMSYISGFSKNSLRQRLSSIYSRENTKKSKYKRDLRIVRNYFEKIGLTEISKSINNELNE